MHNRSPIAALFPTARKEILAAVLMQSDRPWYLSDLAKYIGVTPSSLQRELLNLTEAGILRSKRDGNRIYYQAEKDCPFFAELRGLMLKTAGLVDILREALAPNKKKICLAFIYGSVARSEEKTGSDVDLMIVGDVGMSDLALPLRDAEARLGRPVNATLYRTSEFAKNLKSAQHFLKAVLKSKIIFIIGTSDDLEEASGRQPR